MIAETAIPARVRKIPMVSAVSLSQLFLGVGAGGVWVGMVRRMTYLSVSLGCQMFPPVTVGLVSFCRSMILFVGVSDADLDACLVEDACDCEG